LIITITLAIGASSFTIGGLGWVRWATRHGTRPGRAARTVTGLYVYDGEDK